MNTTDQSEERDLQLLALVMLCELQLEEQQEWATYPAECQITSEGEARVVALLAATCLDESEKRQVPVLPLYRAAMKGGF